MHTKSPALPHRSLRLQPRSINESFTAQERQWQRLMAQNAVDEAQERTKGYLPQIQAALDTLKSQSEKPPPLIADAELYTGKVRDVYKPNQFPRHVVLAATGRQSAFDRALATVPFKGAVLNQVSRWWFETTKDICENHVRASPLPDVLVAARCQAFPVEFVVRGYITGSTSTSLWTHYKNGERKYCGLDFPDGLVKNQKLAENVCTPTTKDAEHDEPISGAAAASSAIASMASRWKRVLRDAIDACPAQVRTSSPAGG
jgi:phosphoribosylaminoimidazole-succinocarboxamide synthase